VKRRNKVRESSQSVSATKPLFSEEQVLSVLMSIPEVKESLSPADAILAAEDVGWISARSSGDGLDLMPQRRERMVKTCRAFWHQDPLAQQAVRLWTDYAVGTGITFNSKDTGITKELTSFWRHRKNKRLTSSRGQQRLSKKLLVDGEVFFAVFGAVDEQKVIRTLDPLQVKDIICDPDDEEEVLCYKRTDRSSPPKTLYYKDWAADDDKLTDLKDPEGGKAIVVEEDVVVYHVPFDDIGKRGNSLLSSCVGWTHEHRKFMEARVSLVRALATFAWKVTAKGGQKVLDKIKSDLNSSLSQSPTRLERNPPATAGSTWAQNQGIDMTPMPRATGATEAGEDSRNLRLMHCAATGTFPHYYGDGRDANLATADAMELPMLKEFTGYQELWKDVWRDIFAIVLDEDIDEESKDVTVTLPAMLQDDLRKLGTFLTGLHQVFPEVQVPEILQMCLVALGVNDVDKVMASIAAKKAENATLSQVVPPHQVPQPVPAGKGTPVPNAPGAQPVKEAATMKIEAAKIKALNRLSKVLTEVFAA
jgi:hypothetical protein